MRSCSRCGTTAEAPEASDGTAGIPNGWSFGVESTGRITYICPDCARANIRAIEGKLPEEYWER
jgi:DNA-directed RNA polymerase subunit RPC12/RpoP